MNDLEQLAADAVARALRLGATGAECTVAEGEELADAVDARGGLGRFADDNRSLRIYGTEVVVGRLMTGLRQARVFLLNYSNRPVLGMRVRIRGGYSKGELRDSGIPESRLADVTQDGPATEFTVPELRVFAVIDLH